MGDELKNQREEKRASRKPSQLEDKSKKLKLLHQQVRDELSAQRKPANNKNKDSIASVCRQSNIYFTAVQNQLKQSISSLLFAIAFHPSLTLLRTSLVGSCFLYKRLHKKPPLVHDTSNLSSYSTMEKLRSE